MSTPVTAVETKIGRIEVRNSSYTNENYPGFVTSLYNKNGKILVETLFEVDQTGKVPKCKIHIFDTTSEEPIINLCGWEEGENMELGFLM